MITARDWDIMQLEVEQEFQELLQEMEAEWIGDRQQVQTTEVVSGETENLPRQEG